MTKAQKTISQSIVLLLVLAVLAVIVLSRFNEVQRTVSKQTANVELILPPHIDGTVEKQVYADLPDIDITSWEYLLCNPAHNIGQYAPDVAQIESSTSYFDVRAMDALLSLLQGARDAGFAPRVYVGYRSYITQSSQYNSVVADYERQGYSTLDAEKAAAEVSAAPGTSEHQTGLALDLLDRYTETLSGYEMDPNFEAWLNEHCAEYGFIMRYPENKISVTGRYEPWHIRYVGTTVANFMQLHDLCLEEFVTLY